MASILVKDIPPHLHDLLRERAQRNRRSINNEVISCLESLLVVVPADPLLDLEEARAMRKKIRGFLTQETLTELKTAGRL